MIRTLPFACKSLCLTLLLAGALQLHLNAQTMLGIGDIAFVSYESDGDDVWAFVLLQDVTATTTINFTDNGWYAVGGFRPGEGTLTWEATADLTAGTIVVFTDDTPDIGSAYRFGLCFVDFRRPDLCLPGTGTAGQ